MFERSRPPTSIAWTVISERGSTVTVVPSRKVIRARASGPVRMRSPTDRLVPLAAVARPPSARTRSTVPPSTVRVAAVETVGGGAWARADAWTSRRQMMLSGADHRHARPAEPPTIDTPIRLSTPANGRFVRTRLTVTGRVEPPPADQGILTNGG
jgi:hypothetical protein